MPVIEASRRIGISHRLPLVAARSLDALGADDGEVRLGYPWCASDHRRQLEAARIATPSSAMPSPRLRRIRVDDSMRAVDVSVGSAAVWLTLSREAARRLRRGR
jgi:hypothetical protein